MKTIVVEIWSDSAYKIFGFSPKEFGLTADELDKGITIKTNYSSPSFLQIEWLSKKTWNGDEEHIIKREAIPVYRVRSVKEE